MEKINFQNGVTPVNADTFNTFQNNIEKSAVIVSKNEPTTNEKVWFQKGKNYLNKINYGKYFDSGDTLEFRYNNAFACTDFIEIKQNVDYVFSHQLGSSAGNIVCFDSNFNYIEAINNQAITTKFNITKSNVKYIIIQMYKSSGISESNESWAQLEQGSTATNYEPYIEPKIFIKNSNGIYEEFVQEYGEEYYTEERKIGTWLGKPLYRKVIINNGPFVKGEQVFNNGIANVDKIINVYGMARRNDGKDQPLTTTYFNSSVWNVSIFDVSNTKYSLMLGENQVELYQITQLEIIFEYTKTTD